MSALETILSIPAESRVHYWEQIMNSSSNTGSHLDTDIAMVSEHDVAQPLLLIAQAELMECLFTSITLLGWQEDFITFDARNKNNNVLLVAPTGSGKSLMAKYLLLKDMVIYGLSTVLVLPYVSLVNETLAAMQQLALQFDFAVEPYVGLTGNLPPPKRGQRPTLYICVYEKALALILSLRRESSLQAEIGLVVVDELHLISNGVRGAVLETLLTIIMFLNKTLAVNCKPVQIMGMTATLGNIDVVAKFLHAKVFTADISPVKVVHHMTLGANVYELKKYVSVDEKTSKLCSELKRKLDLSGNSELDIHTKVLLKLVSETFSDGNSCLVFCPTKHRCKVVAKLLATHLPDIPITEEQVEDRKKLIEALSAEQSPKTHSEFPDLLMKGVAFHNADVNSIDMMATERSCIEEAYKKRIVKVIACTSTLAVGVNLPAKRVIIRCAMIGSAHLTSSEYWQMVGRAGRMGYEDCGESYILCDSLNAQNVVLQIVNAPLRSCTSCMHENDFGPLKYLILRFLSKDQITPFSTMMDLAECTLLSQQLKDLQIEQDLSLVVEKCIQFLKASQCIKNHNNLLSSQPVPNSHEQLQQTYTSQNMWTLTKIGLAAVHSSVPLEDIQNIYNDLIQFSTSFDISEKLQIIFLLCQNSVISGVEFTTSEQIKTLGIWCDVLSNGEWIRLRRQHPAIQIRTISPFTMKAMKRLLLKLNISTGFLIKVDSCPEFVINDLKRSYQLNHNLQRLWVTMIIHMMQMKVPVGVVAEMTSIPRGQIYNMVQKASSVATAVVKFSQEFDELWAYAGIIAAIARNLTVFFREEYAELMELTYVGVGRARLMFSCGLKSVKDVAAQSPKDLCTLIPSIPPETAQKIVACAKTKLVTVMRDLKEEAQMLEKEIVA